jgi:hypothetical protein
MAARAALYTLLDTDAELETLGVQAVYPTNAVDTPAEDCFLVVRWDPTTAAFGTVGADRVQIWAHDKDRDYGRIDSILRRLRQLLTAQVHLSGADGQTLVTAEWRGESQDLFDDGYQTVARYADFTAVSR